MPKLSIIYDSMPTFQGEVTKLDITEYNQTIEINYVSRYVGGQYWLVSFNIITMTPQSATKQIDPYIATINVAYEPYQGTWENRLKNPIGFKVVHYGVETQGEFEGRERELLKDKRS